MRFKAFLFVVLSIILSSLIAQPLSVTIDTPDTVICDPPADLAFTINATTTGGTPPYSYLWAPGGAYWSGHVEDIIATPPYGTVTEYIIMVTDAAGDTVYDTVYVSVGGGEFSFANVDVLACQGIPVEVGCPIIGGGAIEVIWRTLDGDSVGAGHSFTFVPDTAITLVAHASYPYCTDEVTDTVLVDFFKEPPGPFGWRSPLPDDTLAPGMVELCWEMPSGATPIYFNVFLDEVRVASWRTDTCYSVGPFSCGETHWWFIEAFNLCDSFYDGCGTLYYDSLHFVPNYGDTFSGGFDPPFHISPCDTPIVFAEIIEPLPNTWTSCADQQITMTLESGGSETVRIDIPSLSSTTDYWDTTSGSWVSAHDIFYAGWGSYILEGTSWIWDSHYSGAVTGRRLTFQTLIVTPEGAEIDSAFISFYADNSAIIYMNGDSVGADDDGATWNRLFTFELTDFMHGGVDTLHVLGIDLTGVAVGVNFLVSVFYSLDCELDLSSVEFSVSGVNHIIGDGYLDFITPSYLLFTPSGSALFSDGDTVTACLNSMENNCGSYLASPICWDFYVDLTPPHIDNTQPENNTFIADPFAPISADILDFGSGVDESTISMSIAGIAIDESDYTLSPIAGGFNIEYTPDSPIMATDTIWVCISATDTTDYCPDNVMDTCWFFFSMSAREVWFPTVFGTPCDTVLIPLSIDDLETSWIGRATFVFSMDKNILRPISIVTSGALTHGWGVSGLAVDTLAGTISASIAGTPLAGGSGGDFLYLRAVVPCNARGGRYTYIDIDTIYFNDGIPFVDWTPGLFAVELVPRMFSADIRLNRASLPTEDYTLTIAAYPGGSDDFDPGLDIQRVPPPDWMVKGYFPMLDEDYPHIDKLMRDVRAVNPPVTWHLITENEPNGVARWQPSRFPEGEFRMNGVIDMKRDSIAYFATNDTLVIEWTLPELGARLLDFEPGWNLVSSPLLPEGVTASQVFNAAFDVYRFHTPTSAYGFADYIRDGEGYWVWANSEYTVTLIGSEIHGYRRPIYRGWNLIGAAIDTIAVSDIDILPSGGIVGDIFGWDGAGYVAVSELIPGNGYWLLSNNEGVLHAPSGWRRRAKNEPRAEWTGRILLGETALEIGFAPNASIGIGLGDRAIPPASPNCDNFDFALINEGIALSRDLSPSGEWEISLSKSTDIRFELPKGIAVEIADMEFMDGDRTELNAGVYKIKSNAILPDKFEVLDAVPNPFNSATEFLFRIPIAGTVEIEIFDISGRKVLSREGYFEAGHARFRWNGEDDALRCVASGLYFARLSFGNESVIVKSMFIK